MKGGFEKEGPFPCRGVWLGALRSSSWPNSFWETSSCLFLKIFSVLLESSQIKSDIMTRHVPATEQQVRLFPLTGGRAEHVDEPAERRGQQGGDIASWLVTLCFCSSDAAGFLEPCRARTSLHVHLSPQTKSQKPLEWLTRFHPINYSFGDLGKVTELWLFVENRGISKQRWSGRTRSTLLEGFG